MKATFIIITATVTTKTTAISKQDYCCYYSMQTLRMLEQCIPIQAIHLHCEFGYHPPNPNAYAAHHVHAPVHLPNNPLLLLLLLHGILNPTAIAISTTKSIGCSIIISSTTVTITTTPVIPFPIIVCSFLSLNYAP